jgi:hypothetical protein
MTNMGREVRRVPPKWEHPRYTKEDAPYRNLVGEYRRCYDRDYETAAKKWISDFHLWQSGEHPDQKQGYGKSMSYYWEWCAPPTADTCRPAFIEAPTWYQVYETVTEGTPVSPPFATLGKLEDWIVTNGEFRHSDQPLPSRENVRSFLSEGKQ